MEQIAGDGAIKPLTDADPEALTRSVYEAIFLAHGIREPIERCRTAAHTVAPRVQAAAAVREAGLQQHLDDARHDARETRREVLAVREDLADATRELREAAVREAGLREALHKIRDRIGPALDLIASPLADANQRAGAIAALAVIANVALVNPSPAAAHVEAEARLGRAYAALVVETSRDGLDGHRIDAADTELCAALDALLALDGAE